RKDDFVKNGGRNPFGVGDLRRILGRTELMDGMAVPVETVGIVPAVIVAFEFEELRASGMGTSEAQGEHGRFTAGIGKTHGLRGRNHPPKTLGGFGFSGRGCREVRTLGDRFRNDVYDLRMRVPVNERAERHHEVYVLVSVDIPNMRATSAFKN